MILNKRTVYDLHLFTHDFKEVDNGVYKCRVYDPKVNLDFDVSIRIKPRVPLTAFGDDRSYNVGRVEVHFFSKGKTLGFQAFTADKTPDNVVRILVSSLWGEHITDVVDELYLDDFPENPDKGYTHDKLIQELQDYNFSLEAILHHLNRTTFKEKKSRLLLRGLGVQ